ncbi:MAG: antiviral reverse transcriptase Drt3b [Bacteroidales bacterium]
MHKAKGKIVGLKKERVVLSDILPYEVPPYFSNRFFYNFLVTNKVCFVDDELRFKKDKSRVTEKMICLMFGLRKDRSKYSADGYDFYKIDDKHLITIPYSFRIAHKIDDYRELKVIHPINQLQIIQFYDKYKFTIKDATSKSKFSLRKPDKIASLKYYKDSTHTKKQSVSQELEVVESSNKEYTSLKTFFSYQRCNNIFEFYESYEYQRAEKRFNKLLKFDISRCFDSVYTHSISWALLNKRAVKERLDRKTTFGHKFDELMQRMNYNETSGIIIGPEFSRIFAEIILQSVDVKVNKALSLKNIEVYSSPYQYKKDYDIYRYVDDYFVFFNDDKVKDEVLKLFKIELQKYNLYFNESKTELFNQPIITNISIAKEEIKKLAEHSLIFKLDKSESDKQLGIKYDKAKDIITNYKIILANTHTTYKDLQNYFLVVMFNQVKKMVKKMEKEQKKLIRLYDKKEQNPDEFDQSEIDDQKKIVKTYFSNIFYNLNEVIELSFFVYTVLPKVSYSIKLCHILYRIIDFIKNQEKTKQQYSSQGKLNSDALQYIAFEFDQKHTIFKKIFDGILLVLSKNKLSKYSVVETLYLLPIVNELGKHYSFSEETLCKHFKIVESDINLDYFTIISLLNHIECKPEYRGIRRIINNIVRKKMANYEENKAEDVYLLMDMLVCPYIEETQEKLTEFRTTLLHISGYFDEHYNEELLLSINSRFSNVFCNWNEKNYGIELNTKRGHSVY